MKKGFTLIELLVAMLILLVGILGYYGLLASVAKHRANTYHLGEAIMIARSKIEEIRISNFDNLGAGTEVREGFYLSWNATLVNGTDGKIKDISLLIGWGGECSMDEIKNCLHTLELQTSVFKQD